MNNKDKNKQFIQFLAHLQTHGLLSKINEQGLVVYADDHYVNREAMRMTFEDLGLSQKLLLFQDGLETVNYFDSMIDKFVNDIL